jgi:hypothetical protein
LKTTKAFSFETFRLKHPDFFPKIREIWDRQVRGISAVDVWYIKTNRVKFFLKGWGLSLRGHNKRYRRILQEELMTLEELEEKGALPAQLLERKTFIQAEILRSAVEEELYWHKRSNSTWLLKGDNNTDYFHRIANGKKRKNAIFSLQHGEITIEGEKEILVHATNYYKDLFGPSDNPKMKNGPPELG